MQEKKLSLPLLGRVAIAADHGGFELKAQIQSKFSDVEWIDLGAGSTDSVDYPDYAHKLADAIKAGQAESGILICGTGIGISIAANRHDHIRAALCTNVTMARLTRAHNNANVLCLGARITGAEAAFDIAQAFLETEFEGGRHDRRIDKINE
jgi:ribose 5-phosphate isomerase B